ncbi:MAG TPA: hypothetical protein VGI42_06710 [Chthoniobacterales bacterium]|jgi:hypothetical protein
MKLARTGRIKGEGGIALLVIVLLLLGGIVWWLYSSRRDAERNGRAFANDVIKRVALNYDEKYLHVHLSPEAQVSYLKSWRDRLIDRLRELGTPAQPIELTGSMYFSSYFFDPKGTFRAELKYPTTSAYMDLGISRGMTVWRVDMINLTWTPPPTPTPTPTPTPVATPTPTPAPELKSKPKRKSKR